MCLESHGSKGRQSQPSHAGSQLRAVLLTTVLHCLTEGSRAQRPLLPYPQRVIFKVGIWSLALGPGLDGPYRSQLPHP